MGFFDNFGRRVSDISQKALQKTGEFSEINRINSQISANEEQINNAYFQIGKLFVSIYGRNCSSEFSGLISTIAELENQNEELKKKIQKIRRVQHCTNCGAEVPEGVAFCSVCGNRMENYVENQSSELRCLKCGMPLREGLRFCTSCGRAVVGDVVISQPAAGQLQKEVNAVCPQCGSPISGNDDFCMECGLKLRG